MGLQRRPIPVRPMPEINTTMAHRLIDELVSQVDRLALGIPAHDSVLHALQEMSLAAEAFSDALTPRTSVTESQAAVLQAQDALVRAQGSVQRALALQEQLQARRR
jgi:hypothetical protein